MIKVGSLWISISQKFYISEVIKISKLNEKADVISFEVIYAYDNISDMIGMVLAYQRRNDVDISIIDSMQLSTALEVDQKRSVIKKLMN